MELSGDDAAGRPWILVELRRQQYALAANEVSELLIAPEITSVPGVGGAVQGVTTVRGSVIPVLDLRRRLGMTSRSEEIESFCGLMEQRRLDHVHWVTELENCVRENRKFTLATDPHLCAFGRWYYSYRPDNVWIANLLGRFESPHATIHQTAAEATALLDRHDTEAALRLIASRRTTVLSSMLDLFSRLQQLIREIAKDTVLVLDDGSRRFGVAVDSALRLEEFAGSDIQHLPPALQGTVTRVARKDNSSSPVLLLSARALFG